MAFRYQPDWLLSCYRESIHEHHYQKIEDFLCFSEDTKSFFRPTSSINENGYAHLYALNLDYGKMISTIYKNYEKEDVFTYF